MIGKTKVPPRIAAGFVVFIVLLGAWFWLGLADLLSAGRIENLGERVRYGGRPLLPARFPVIQDFGSVKIGLDVTDLAGPDYSITIHGDGRVVYDGRDGVTLAGRRTARIDKAAVERLVEAFKDEKFFWLKAVYDKPDIPNQRPAPDRRVSLSFDDKAMSVREHRGREVGMPRAVLELADAVKRTAGAQRWTVGDAGTVAALQAEGVDLKADTPQVGALLVAAARAANTRVVADLIAAGVPLKGEYGCRALSTAAFGRRHWPVAQLLSKAGAPMKAGDCEVPTEWPGLRADPDAILAPDGTAL